jgi:tetratricopeptide (TPR) repeat protein
MKIRFACLAMLCFVMLMGWHAVDSDEALVAQSAAADKAVADGAASNSRAQIFDGMGPHRRAITTDSAEAQRYFDQGLTWMYAFNHDEAIRSFTRAAELDGDCAMAWWGVALCEGPNYNDAVMTEERSSAAWDALSKSLERIENTAPIERALIEALRHRYAKPWPEDRTALDKAYADAMAKVWEAYPSDSDVGTLWAESMMVQKPWKLYTLDRKPVEGTEKIVAVLERVMKMDPDHPGANHLYIHAVEPSDRPDRGLAAAERLRDLVPASGHLLHMPSHIYVKTGRWNESIIQNEKAMRADAKYRSLSPKQAFQHLYMVHNAHMLAYSAMMSGREKEALAAARAMWNNIPDDALREVGPLFDLWMCSVYDVQKRFGRWDAILAEEPPPSFLPITTAIWRAHRAIAYAAKKDFANACREEEEFRRAKAALPEEHLAITDLTHTILDVSEYFIAGEIALQQDRWEEAAKLLEDGARIEDSLSYGEPPQWLQPIRHTLGAVYLKSQHYEQAERVYREDLAKWPNNGWSLFGLSRALELQGSKNESDAVKRQYDRAWSRADEQIDTSCKCIPKT